MEEINQLAPYMIHCICSFEFALLAHILFSSKGKHAIHAWLIVTIKFWYQAYERCLTKYKLYWSMQRMLFVCSRESYHGINYTAENKFRKQYQGPKLSLNMPLWLMAWHSGWKQFDSRLVFIQWTGHSVWFEFPSCSYLLYPPFILLKFTLKHHDFCKDRQIISFLSVFAPFKPNNRTDIFPSHHENLLLKEVCAEKVKWKSQPEACGICHCILIMRVFFFFFFYLLIYS